MRISPMSTIKVLHVIARMNVGGTARYVGELVKGIPDNALATGYVQGAEIEDAIVENIQIYRLEHMGRRISPISDFKAWLELGKLVKEINPQILHTHTFKAGLLGRLVGGDHKRVHTFHGHLFGDESFSGLERRAITFFEKFLAARTDFLVSVGEKVGQELREAGVGKKRKWISIPPGVNPLPLIEKREARVILGLNQDQILVGWMARMAEVKNPFLLLAVAKQLPSVNFVMAGGGKLFQDIVNAAPSNVLVIGWTEASTFWSAVDCAISTSDNEGMPVALIEAQLSGVPAIATDVGSNSEVINSGATGLVVEKELEQLVRAVEKLVHTNALRLEMGRSSRDWAEQQFSMTRMLHRHEDMYSTLLSERG